MYRGARYDHPGVLSCPRRRQRAKRYNARHLDQLFAQGSACVVKMNPVNDYLGPFYEQIFSQFVSRGLLRFVYGAADPTQAALLRPLSHDSSTGQVLCGGHTHGAAGNLCLRGGWLTRSAAMAAQPKGGSGPARR